VLKSCAQEHNRHAMRLSRWVASASTLVRRVADQRCSSQAPFPGEETTSTRNSVDELTIGTFQRVQNGLADFVHSNNGPRLAGSTDEIQPEIKQAVRCHVDVQFSSARQRRRPTSIGFLWLYLFLTLSLTRSLSHSRYLSIIAGRCVIQCGFSPELAVINSVSIATLQN